MPRNPDRDADRQLAARCVEGDADAWGELVRRHETTVYFAVRNALRLRGAHGDEDLVLDLVSEVFYRLVRGGAGKLSQYGGRCSLKHWLKVVTGNFVIDVLRRRRADCSLDDPNLAGLRDSLPSATPTPDAVLDAERRALLLRDLWDTLNVTDRRFVELYYEQELDYEAVAEAMDTSVAAVYTRKNRVTRKLRAALRRRQRLKGAGR